MSLPLLLSILVAAVLYSSVGYGGASGYLAAMALFGLDPGVMRPAALTMNIFVTTLVFTRLYRAGHFNSVLFLPFALASIPFSFLGGTRTLDAAVYGIVVGLALLAAALVMLFTSRREDRVAGTPPWWVIWPLGAVLGLLSGLTGVGGGIYLSPLLLLMHWSTVRGASAIASAFILLNSVAGLGGYLFAGGPWPDGVPAFVAVAVVGGLIGSELGVRRLSPRSLRKVLAVVLIVAGAKLATGV